MLIVFFFGNGTEIVHGATCLRPGEVVITLDQRAAATAAGVPADYPCWIPGQPYVGQDVGEAKQFLKSLPRKSVNDSRCAPPESDKNIDDLNPTFAVCAAQFFKAYIERHGQVVITSAFRSDAPGSAMNGSGKSANQCAGGVPGSNHTRGVAMDVKPVDERMYPTLWKFASDNPQFGVCFPFQNNPIPGYPNGDRPHMILAGIGGSEGARCAAQGVTQKCSGSPVLNITNTPVQPASPTKSFADTVRQAFGLPTQQMQVSTSQPAIPSQPASASQNPLSAFNEPQAAPGVSSQINTSVNTNFTSSTIATQLEELAFGPKPATSTTATSVPLVVSGANAAVLTGSQNPTVASTNSVSGVSNPVQQTFTSGDLSWQGSSDELVSSNPVSGMTAILITLKSALTRLMQYLVPFGVRTQVNGSGEMGE